MSKYIVDFGVVQIGWYPVFILLGIIIASMLINNECKKYNANMDFINNLIFWTVVFGIIGARIYFVLFHWDYYSANMDEIYKIWNGGLAIHGGIIFGLIFSILYCLKYKVRILKITDVFVVGLIFAQAIGRWGNFFNKEAHGPEVAKEALEKLLFIPKFIINGMNIDGIYYHPTFYYESLWCILGFIVLLLVRKYYKYLKVGQLTSIYFVWYGIGRFFIEGLRTDSLMFLDLKIAQIISLVFILIGIIMFIVKRKKSVFEDLYKEVDINEVRF